LVQNPETLYGFGREDSAALIAPFGEFDGEPHACRSMAPFKERADA
jgi:hypothetical protein